MSPKAGSLAQEEVTVADPCLPKPLARYGN